MSLYLQGKKPHVRGKKSALRLTPEEIRLINKLWNEGNTVGRIAVLTKRSPTIIEKAIGVEV